MTACANNVLSAQRIVERRLLGNEFTDKDVKQGANYQCIQQYLYPEP